VVSHEAKIDFVQLGKPVAEVMVSGSGYPEAVMGKLETDGAHSHFLGS